MQNENVILSSAYRQAIWMQS